MPSDVIASPESVRSCTVECHAASRSDEVADKQLVSADVILMMLHAIAHESEAVYARSQALLVAQASVATAEHIMATRQLSHTCNLLMAQIAALQKLVIEFDEIIAGPETGSLAELGVRAQTLAILLLLDELCDALPCQPSAHQGLFTERLQTIDDVVWHLFDSLARINRPWIQHRVKRHISDVSRSPLYRSDIRRAQLAIAALGADPDLAHFLRVGSSSTDVPRLRHVCEQLAEAFGATLIREPDPALLLVAAMRELVEPKI